MIINNNIMKRLPTLLLCFLLILVSCTKYDDSSIQSRIDRLVAEVEGLKEQCSVMNSNIYALQSVIEAVRNQERIVEVKDLADGTGYSITFSSGRTITLRNGVDGRNGRDGQDGKDGQNGKDGRTPTVSVRLDSDGVYYWTIDGAWLLDGNGKKIRAQGQDGSDGKDGANGVTPQLKIQESWWYVSYDNGVSWTKLYKATGEDGDAFFSSVTDNGETVTIKLKDGTTFNIPKAAGELGIRFSESEDIAVSAGGTKEIEYTILNGSSGTLVKVFGQNGWNASVRKKDASCGTIAVTAPVPLVEGEVVVLVYEGDSKTVVRFLNFIKGTISAPKAEYSFSGKEGTYEVNLNANIDYSVSIPDEAASWLTYSGIRTKAMRQDRLEFHCTQNYGPEPRSAVVTITDNGKENTLKISITQKVWDAIDIPDANLKAALVEEFDTDSDGEISREEARAVEQISVMNKGIKSMDGIQHFENLYHLDCSFNNLSSIDLSHNPRLRLLSIAHNSFTSIDLSKVSLENFICFENDLAEIDLSGQSKLRSISCGYNTKLKTLDMSDCSQSVDISAIGCSSLLKIYLQNGQTVAFKEIPADTKIVFRVPDGTVNLLQKHSVGRGIKFVIMGDGYLGEGLETEYGGDSKFGAWARRAMEAIFSEEPYKTFRNRFDVYSVAVESETESFDGGTALGCTFGGGTQIKGNSDKVFEYARKVSGVNLTESVVIVILNSPKYAGTCWYWSDHKAIAYVPTTDYDVNQFSQTMRHEAGGHGFAKLLDEYSYSGTISSSEISTNQWWYNAIGAGANVDVTNDPAKVRWAHFLSDARYSGQVGIYQGALTYQYGAYRPTDNSIMRYNVGGYNAPSREAIYKRIMTLSEGSGWKYDYETFVAYDSINRSAASQVYHSDELRNFDERSFVPLAPPVFVY